MLLTLRYILAYILNGQGAFLTKYIEKVIRLVSIAFQSKKSCVSNAIETLITLCMSFPKEGPMAVAECLKRAFARVMG